MLAPKEFLVDTTFVIAKLPNPAARSPKSHRAWLILGAALGLSAPLTHAQLTPDQEYGKFVDRAKAVTPMSDFGDQVSPRDGAVTFRATDVELKGTGPTIRITRTYTPNFDNVYTRETSGNGFGGWELEIPRIKTIVAYSAADPTSSFGWQVNGPTAAYRNQRCKNFAAPSRITWRTDLARGWNPWEWWDGYYVVDSSGQQQPLMSRNDTSVNPSYGLITSGNWLVTCLTSTANGQDGEAFVALAPDGTKYTFNYLVYTMADTITKPLWNANVPALVSPKGPALQSAAIKTVGDSGGGATPNIIGGGDGMDQLERRWASMLVTRIEDRFGNKVNYTYNAGKLSSIDATDGRHVGFTFDTSGRISTITAGTGDTARTWTYTYTGTTDGVSAMVVNLPDKSTWQYSLPVLGPAGLDVQADMANCTLVTTPGAPTVNGSITSPAGATLSLTFNAQRFARSYVFKQCWGGDPTQPGTGFASYPRDWYTWSLVSKTVTGIGLPSMTWKYDYSTPTPSWSQDCPTPTSCASTAWTDITDPEGNRHRSIFSSKFDETENKLLREEIYASSGQLQKAIDHAYATVALGVSNPYPWYMPVGDDKRKRVNSQTAGRWSPERNTVITQDGVTFTRTVNSFDSYARAVNVTRSSSLGQSLTEAITYTDFPSLWLLGQVGQVSANGLLSVVNTYDSAMGTLLNVKKFGVQQASYTYLAEGNLNTQTDGAGHTTTYANWYRGMPRSVTYPTGATELAVLDERGWVRQWTTTAGYTTLFDYDLMGRLIKITPPAGWTETLIKFEPVATAEYGLLAGHWRQTVNKGSAVAVTYFDAYWRPVMTRMYDSGAEATTRKVIVKGYDSSGRVNFESYPQRTADTYPSTGADSYTIRNPGVRTQYDALGRTTLVQADSELGVLPTSTAYLSGFQAQTTNPRNQVTTQSFWALDDPGKAQLATITAPEGVNVSISRDVFGKPTAITRSGSANGYTSSVTRRYVYDAGQRLCKTIEPEIGSTVLFYDAASNIAWRAPGQALPDAGACNDTSVPDSGKIVYGYDALNRLLTTTYGDNSPGITRTLTPDGLLQTIASNGSTWTYGYNSLRKLTTESFNYAGQTFNFSWGFNAAGDASSLTYPDRTVTYSPNALGEITNVSGYASGVSYHPNGAVAGYTLGNNVVHSLTQNLRGLPLLNSDAGVVKDLYAYDANGNVTSITDQQEGVFNRSMGYDGLDRLTSTSAPGVWGNATYAYDPVDNLRAATVGVRNTVMNIGANNQLQSVTTNGSTATYGFDARGNLIVKGGQTFGFDLGNRLSSSSLGGRYAYDGHGRRFWIASSDGSTRLQLYSQAGQILWATSTGGPRPTSTTAYIYLGGKQIAEVDSVAGTPQYAHTDALGSPVAHTNTNGAQGVINRSRFEPYGYVAAGTKPSPSTSAIGFTGHVQDAETDLVYMQQRYYDPIAARFLSVDPVVTDNNTGKAFGRYTYVDNNPYAKTDPDGRAPRMGECGWLKSMCEVYGDVAEAGSKARKYLRDMGSSMRMVGGEITALEVPKDTWESAGFRHHQAIVHVLEPFAVVLEALGYGGDGVPGNLAVGPIAAVKGGVGPVLKGELGVAQSIAAAEARGETVLGREITMETAGGRTRNDLLVQDAQGNKKFIESKCGSGACLNTNQAARFPELRESGGIPRGKNAAAAGLTPGKPIGPTPVQEDYWP